MSRGYRFAISLMLATICLSVVLLQPIVASEKKAVTSSGIVMPGNWTTQKAYPVPYGNYTYATSIAADADSNAHVAFLYAPWNNTPVELVYASNSGGTWHNDTICRVPGTYWAETGIVIPSDGQARIGLANRTGVYFFEKSSGAWTSSTVDVGPVNYSTMTMLLDSHGAIRFYYQMNTTVKEALRGPAGWIQHDFLNTSSWGPVALDSAGHVHTAIATADGLVHLSNVTGVWATEMVDVGSAPREISIGFSGPPANNVTIAYIDGKEHNVKVASNSTSDWTFVIVRGGSSSDYFNGLSTAQISSTFDPKYPIQNIRLAFYSDSDLMVTSTSVDGPHYMGGGNAIEEGLTSTGPTDMASDPNGHMHLLYQNSEDGALKYATDALRVPPRPLFEEIASGYHSITLSWRWFENYGESHTFEFRVYRVNQEDSNGRWELVGTVHARGLPPYNSYSDHTYSFTQSGLRSDRSYYYSVSGVNDVGEGIRSSTLSAVPDSALSPDFIAFVVSFAAAMVLASVVIIQNRKRIKAIMRPKTPAREYHAPTGPKTTTPPDEVDKEEVVDGHPELLKKT